MKLCTVDRNGWYLLVLDQYEEVRSLIPDTPSVKKVCPFLSTSDFGVKVHQKNCCGFRDKENDKSVSVQTINCSAKVFPTSPLTINPVN